jgi:hypothetical protein
MANTPKSHPDYDPNQPIPTGTLIQALTAAILGTKPAPSAEAVAAAAQYRSIKLALRTHSEPDPAASVVRANSSSGV